MLVQSHEGVIDLLPALPAAWGSGNFEGVCARGAFELSFKWENNKLTHASILSKAGEICKINLPVKVKVICNGKAIKTQLQPNGVLSFATQKDAVYQISNF